MLLAKPFEEDFGFYYNMEVASYLFVLECFGCISQDADGPANRKVLLQRYREKRKDRYLT